LWTFRRCPNPLCSLIWLDPSPLPEELPKAYKRYFTHQTMPVSAKLARPSLYKLGAEAVKTAYIARHFGHPSKPRGLFQSLLALSIYVSPLHRAAIDMSCGHLLRHSARGRLLDVGCGAGDLLLMARDLGWDAEGIDFDSEAVATARGKGLTAFAGQLSERCYPDESFDLVQMSHVIEHVPRPAELVRECYRLLRQNGSLIIWTPNSASLGHRFFGERWGNLDPPRHLQLWNPAGLKELVRTVGFRSIELKTDVRMTPYVLRFERASVCTSRLSRRLASIWKRVVNLSVGTIEQAVLMLRPFVGEEIILTARK
jgi:2-polyprenyl-3-methyl-5-hydroxy-6-metoxy-1,4-benzoquinol methylase